MLADSVVRFRHRLNVVSLTSLPIISSRPDTASVRAANGNNSLPEALYGFVGSQHFLMCGRHPFKQVAGDQAVELYLGALSELVYHRVFFGKRCFELGICT